MIGFFITLVLITVAFRVARAWWPSHLNPVTFGIIAWSPALFMLNFRPYFVSPLYIHLNRPVGLSLYIALLFSFMSFWLGCLLVKTLSKRGAFTINEGMVLARFSPERASILFLTGFAVLMYAYWQSGLVELRSLDPNEIAVRRLALHLGWLSFANFLMDATAIGFFAYFVRTGRFAFLLPTLIAFLAYGATLQKSPIVGLLAGCLLAAAIQPRSVAIRLWGNGASRLVVILAGTLLVLTMFGMNDARGMSDVQMTAADAAWKEQMFIYSGATAILNLAATIDGYLPSNEAALGAYLARPVLWLLLDMDKLQFAQNFEGVNTATYMIYGWSDFRWVGFFIMPFLLGCLVMSYLRFALSGSLWGLLLGAVAVRALIISPSTDFVFDPNATIFIVIAIFASWFTDRSASLNAYRSRST